MVSTTCMNQVAIGITGFARSGKDTLAGAIRSGAMAEGLRCQIFSLAHALKSDLNDFCLDKFGISAFTEDSESKSKIRPVLIAYGVAKRESTKGTYWFNKLKKEIDSFFVSGGQVAIIPDIRFKEYEYDEYDFVRSYKQNMLIHLTRILEDGSQVQPAHKTEKANADILFRLSDKRILWNSNLAEVEVANYAKPIIKIINKKIKL